MRRDSSAIESPPHNRHGISPRVEYSLSLCLVVVSACGSLPTDPATDTASTLDGQDFQLVREVSPDLADFGWELEHLWTCVKSEQLGETRLLHHPPSVARRLGNGFEPSKPATAQDVEADHRLAIEQRRVTCNVLAETIVEKDVVFEIVRETGRVPSSLFVFRTSRFRFDVLDEAHLGPFRNIEQCNALALRLHDAGFPTQRCQRFECWNRSQYRECS